MRHFPHLDDAARHRLFHRMPGEFDRDSDAAVLAVALGATLYCPATRGDLADLVTRRAAHGVVSMVLCLEDAIDDSDVPAGEANLVREVTALVERGGDGAAAPLLFVRVRTPEQIGDLVARLGPAARRISGFVLPKFTESTGGAFLEAVADAEYAAGLRMFAMPVLESPSLIHLETRRQELTAIAGLLEKYRERVLAVRLGVTDFCSAYGLRRAPDLTAYDIQPVASVIGDVVNVFGRADGTGYTVTGPVWEYFPVQERMFKPQLRRTPFEQADGASLRLRQRLIDKDIDGLIREIELDRANGLLGKTCIHPSHVAPVHALSVVTHEEWSDAVDILDGRNSGGGVLRSTYTNKMNEVKPHRAWAEGIIRRAEVFGVARPEITFAELLSACLTGE
ncbi:HpcH/HpaI aldolase/citrate lyase family protein [Allostreptomyces psammosilenae]|uniref:Citrate lyase beta subunit n=1 Tax=Allostreptomyces psammosilenae TaxID=1892865 RepID=A0A853A7T7_9ACTN|nr:HpcH/HpaI aldolase/citrate lyase family protein [Allostreptomyces psammosilenae]NYI06721.1 citrate lyase beta subunit [Allostreptomyces psammosilenae]